ncbi:MAG: S41 family peptidase [Parcubacteria group bacterium]|nr:S41 family peptidase [Parcubacteria group bacterium]
MDYRAYKKRILLALAMLFALGGAFFLGAMFGLSARPASEQVFGIANKEDGGAVSEADFSEFWTAWNILNEKYIFPKKTTDQEKVYGAIAGLTAAFGDPYTTFFPPTQAELFQSDISGNFEGVGMEIGKREDILTVIAPLKGSPAEKAGVRAGDKILKIDDKVTTDLDTDEAVMLIRGTGGTTVKLTLFREDENQPLEISVIRAAIEIPTIETEKRSDGIFVIRLFSFTANSPTLFRNALREFVASGDDKLLLDLRGNPGGYLDAAVDMASWFLPPGAIVVKEDFGDKGEGSSHRSRGYNIFNKNLKFVILVDGGSASASEILAGALSEHGVAKLVGEKTFGKGSVQEVVPVTEKTFLKVTIARWLTPNGKSINENGLDPDFAVKVTKEDIEKKYDAQLEKAIEVLKNFKKE